MALEEMRMDPDEVSGSAGDNVVESPPIPFPHRVPEYFPISPRRERFASMNDEYMTRSRGSPEGGNDAKSCFVVSVTFSCFAAIVLAFGLYAPNTLQLGPNTSILINPNRLLVESIKIEQLDASKGSMLYGFYKPPPLDVMVSWSEFHNITFPGGTHKEWMYYLNKGSEVKISHNFDLFSSSSLVLAIAKGYQSLASWLEDPSNSNIIFYWTVIHGNGTVQTDIFESSTYYVAVGNVNNEVVKVYLNTSITALLFNTTESYYECSPSEGACIFELSSFGQNSAVLSTPSQIPGMVRDHWNVKISYGPRWLAYLIGTGGLAGLLQLMNYLRSHFCGTQQSIRGDQPEEEGSERDPLVSHKDDSSPLGRSSSSSDSLSGDEEHAEVSRAGGSLATDEDGSSLPLCTICFDAPRDSFFFPCGHCAACFGCSTRIAENSGACPICRRRTKRVRRIYSA